MSGVNKVILVGRAGKDAEVRNLEGGKVVATFSLATSETYKDKSGAKQDKTEWHSIVLWGRIGEIAGKYVKKGDQISIIGKIRTRQWEKDNVTRYTTEIIADELVLLGSSNKGSAQAQSPAPVQETSEEFIPTSNNPGDDLPF